MVEAKDSDHPQVQKVCCGSEADLTSDRRGVRFVPIADIAPGPEDSTLTAAPVERGKFLIPAVSFAVRDQKFPVQLQGIRPTNLAVQRVGGPGEGGIDLLHFPQNQGISLRDPSPQPPSTSRSNRRVPKMPRRSLSSPLICSAATVGKIPELEGISRSPRTTILPETRTRASRRVQGDKVKVNLTVNTGPIDVGGYRVVTEHYNNSYLPPVVRARPGDAVAAQLVNLLAPRDRACGHRRRIRSCASHVTMRRRIK